LKRKNEEPEEMRKKKKTEQRVGMKRKRAEEEPQKSRKKKKPEYRIGMKRKQVQESAEEGGDEIRVVKLRRKEIMVKLDE